MNKNIDLTKILKDCPDGEQFWSPMLGDVKLYNINQVRKIVSVILETYAEWAINADGTITICGITSPEIMLFPSREQRDWTKVKYEPKKERFDPKTLKPFDRVIMKPDNGDWHCSILSHREDNNIYYRMIDGYGYSYVIPYNDNTKHLVGTKDEAPDFYRYWED